MNTLIVLGVLMLCLGFVVFAAAGVLLLTKIALTSRATPPPRPIPSPREAAPPTPRPAPEPLEPAAPPVEPVPSFEPAGAMLPEAGRAPIHFSPRSPA